MIFVDEERCNGCGNCRIACSMKHFGTVNPRFSRIRIEEFRDTGSFVPIVCQACEDSVCIKTCPMNARIRLENGSVVTDEERCIGCRACIYICPLGAPEINPCDGKSMTCDLCILDESGPWCVKACREQNALILTSGKNVSKAKEREYASRVKETYAPPANRAGRWIK